MDKYLVKPTEFVGVEGTVYTTQNLDQTSTIKEMRNKLDKVSTETDEIIEKANIAHSIASGLQEAVGNAESTAIKAQEKAKEAYDSLHSLNADIENLKGRIEDLEKTDGEASVPIVGNSKMGYVSDFSRYGLDNQYYVEAKWNDEIRSLQFGKDDNLGDVITEVMYVTASGISDIHNRVSSLESNSGGSDGNGSTDFGPYSVIQMGYETDMHGYKDYVTPAVMVAPTVQDALNQIQNNININVDVIQDHMAKIKSNDERIWALENNAGGSSSGSGVTSTQVTDAINTAITPIESRITTLENNSESYAKSSEVTEAIDEAVSPIESRVKSIEIGVHLLDTARLQPYSLLTNEAREVLGLPLTAVEETYTYKYYLTEGYKRANYGYGESQVNRNKITALSNTVAGHTSSIQSLDTRTGSHTASIGQLENRMTDVETISNGNKTSITELSNRVDVLENNSSSGSNCDCAENIERLWGSIAEIEENMPRYQVNSIGNINIKSDGSAYTFTDHKPYEVVAAESVTHTFSTLNQLLDYLLPLISEITADVKDLYYSIDYLERTIFDYHG